MATYSTVLAWKTPWTEETGRLQSMGLQRVSHDWTTNTYLLTSFIIVRFQEPLRTARVLTSSLLRSGYDSRKSLFECSEYLLRHVETYVKSVYAFATNPPHPIQDYELFQDRDQILLFIFKPTLRVWHNIGAQWVLDWTELFAYHVKNCHFILCHQPWANK